MKKWTLLMLLIVLLVFGTVIGFNFYKHKKINDYLASRPAKVFPVTAVTLAAEDWTPTLQAIGFISPKQGVTLANEDAGIVSLLNFESGQTVKKGDVLLELDQEVEKANLESAQGKFPAVESTYLRLKKLVREGNVSKENYDKSHSDYLSLIGEIKSSQQTIARRTITAPFSGISGLRQVNLGEYLQPGSPIVRLEDITQVRVRFILPQTEYKNISLNQPVKIYADAYPGKVFDGSIMAIAPVINPDNGVFNVEAVIPNSDLLLRSGMFARVNVELEKQSNNLFVPQTAINYQLYGNSVYVIEQQEASADKGLTVKNVTVKLGTHLEDRVLVKSGVTAGQKIVTSGQLRLNNGSQVHIVQSHALDKPDSIPQL